MNKEEDVPSEVKNSSLNIFQENFTESVHSGSKNLKSRQITATVNLSLITSKSSPQNGQMRQEVNQ